jgi:signal transduction histidine kinase
MSTGDEAVESTEVDDVLTARARAVAGGRQVTSSNEQALIGLGFDLHDGPLQEIAVVTTDLYYLRDQLALALGDETPAVGAVNGVIERLDSVAGEVRRLARGTTSTLSQQPLSQWLAETAELYADVFEIDVDIKPSPQALDRVDLTGPRRTAVVRVVQHALANTAQHSGAYRVTLGVRVHSGWVEVEVRDDGAGFDVREAVRRAEAYGRLGLLGMRHRAEALEGTLVIESAPGGPTTVRLALPALALADQPLG